MGTKPLRWKWVLKKKKLGRDGSIEKYNARLLAKGFRQKEGIDFFDTYSHVSRISSIRFSIAIVVVHNLIIHQMGVKIAFFKIEIQKRKFIWNDQKVMS